VRIAVTGGSGKLGRQVVASLAEAGHEVVNLDRVAGAGPGSMRVDFTDAGQVLDALDGGFDALVHLAAIPAPGLAPETETFRNNMLTTFNVMHAARRAGIDTIVAASSETVLGIPFDTPPPYIPLDENYETRPESVYSLVKALEEELYRKLVRWNERLSITALRFSNVMAPEDYAAFPAYDSDAALRKWNLWGYIDARDGAQAVLRAIERNKPGFDVFIIAAADTVMSRPNAELVTEVFPGVEVRGSLGLNDTLLSIEKARRELGYEPQHRWRD
jgi:UDP-glucose 4-epimerase